jgi:hypothetical protein
MNRNLLTWIPIVASLFNAAIMTSNFGARPEGAAADEKPLHQSARHAPFAGLPVCLAFIGHGSRLAGETPGLSEPAAVQPYGSLPSPIVESLAAHTRKEHSHE